MGSGNEGSQDPRRLQSKQDAPSGLFERVRGWVIAHPIMAVLLVAGFTTAAITVTYTSTTDVSTSSVDPPIQYATGDDTGVTTDYVSAFSISTNKTQVTATVNGVPEANLTVGSFFKLNNVDDGSHSVTLSTSQVNNVNVDVYKIAIHDSLDDSHKGTLDLTAASPSTTFTMAASDTFYAKLYLELASGTTPSSLSGVSPSITLSFT